MKPILYTLALCALPTLTVAQPADKVIDGIIDAHILPRFEVLAAQTATFADMAMQECEPTSEALRGSYARAFDAWISASHLRFGPAQVDDRAFALAFWPDSRGATPRTLGKLIADQDPIVASADTFAQVSIAARGFYAMEFLLFDPALMQAGDPAYHCRLVQTISADIAATSEDIFEDWRTSYGTHLRTPAANGTYRTRQEARQELFKALSTGLQFTSESRLGRPLGRFDRPRPNRAEARRSGRSARHVALSLSSLGDLAAHLTAGNQVLAASIEHSFQRAMAQLDGLNDPVFASVAAPQTRIKVEVLQQSVDAIRAIVRDDLGPTLGVAAGFNALDGD